MHSVMETTVGIRDINKTSQFENGASKCGFHSNSTRMTGLPLPKSGISAKGNLSISPRIDFLY